jgi:hypothetical protein
MGSMTRTKGDELKTEYTVFVLEKQYTKVPLCCMQAFRRS